MGDQIQELKFQVGEAWKGVYSSSTAYGLANVVQDATGLSVYRSLKSGNVGHPLTDAAWWFCIIDMSSIKSESDRIAALNEAIARDEALRRAAEDLRQQHEAARETAEEQRNADETARIQREQQRVAAETARNTAEQQRITAEQGRVSAESARVQAEQARVLAETLRANAEDARAAAEINRAAAEQQRIAAEQEREAGYAADHTRAVEDHDQIAALVERADEDHEQAVADHTTATGDHEQAGTDHTRAEGDHTRAESDHTQAGTDHTRAESDHTQAENDHTQAGQDHTRAEADHTQAAADHEVYATDVEETKERVAALEAIVADLETIAEGYVRVAGSSSPALSYKSYKYHEQGGFGRESVFSLFFPCLVGTKLSGDDAQVGKILHILQKFGAETVDGVPMWRDIYGNLHKIDGSEGDVMVCNVEPYYTIDGKFPIGGTEYDVFLKSRVPFTWQGIEAEHIERGAMSMDYVVRHTDTDNVTRMHSVFNPEWNGSYQAPRGVAGKYICSTDPETGDIVETYDADVTLLGGAGGLHTTDLSLPDGEQAAMNQNPDTTKTVPFMNQTAEMCNRFMSMMLSEGGTFDAHNANKMGSGFSSNDPATAAGDWEQAGSGAKNGVRVVDKDGAWKYHGMNGNVNYLLGQTTGTVYAGEMVNAWRNPWHIMEAHRAVSYAVQNDVHELEWFTFEGNKYKYRSVDGFAGPSQGEMTCVVWKIIATQAGTAAIDPTDKVTSIAGNRVEMLYTTALFHGVTTQVSPSWWVSGLLFTEDENGQYECYIERDQAELVKSIAADNYDPATPRDFETKYQHVLTAQKGEGYAKNYLNGALMLPDTNANKTGATLHTYVGKYNWFTGGNASAGKKSVRGFRRGGRAYYAYLSPLSMGADYSPSAAGSGIGFGTCCRLTEA